MKIHKPDQPIRPIVNWHNAPVYKLAKLFTQRIGHLAALPYTYNIENSNDLIQKLKDTPILPHFAFASLDITNLYPSIPVTETKEILSDLLKHKSIDPQTQRELLNWYEIITKQNYFTFNKNMIVQNDGIAMGASLSGIIAEIFLQHTENLHLAHITSKHSIANYFRYVGDILIIFYPNHTNIQAILEDFSAIHPSLQFTVEMEANNTINYLDLSSHKTPTNWKTSIYRKPTFTDTTIPYTSNHPNQHKYAAIKFLYNRLNSYGLQNKEYQHEENIINNILYNNSFPINPQKPAD